MQCCQDLDFNLSSVLFMVGLLFLWQQTRTPYNYGKHLDARSSLVAVLVPARRGWFLQELPSFLVPALLVLHSPQPGSPGCKLLCCLFCTHYFHRTFIYAALTKGRPTPLYIVILAVIFCTFNGFLQGHCMVYGTEYPDTWFTDIRFTSGILLFFTGMGINIHSDHMLRKLRKPGELTYKIPQGGLFNYVSGANFLGEIVEWFGYAIATWTMPAFSFAFFTLCSIGPRAYHHHRYYLRMFADYPKSRKALIPFIF
ncbi:3-oxo-5-alpha-steroid 4-dehydrogenase 2 isoform X2 [Rhinatrema bivittatum]|uniref:3-oxo-5-alpha-steroid 4-dehydrogenase 2 isoform X2 n=1 Tax=Rhinatrema bivittatum TaxID=194408 RepID=UPI00112992B3|nr:3-oxo-5-alpha-steroid 4-dehydrogenase 2 isoform X2 [Rhinatrema bivittatum]